MGIDLAKVLAMGNETKNQDEIPVDVEAPDQGLDDDEVFAAPPPDESDGDSSGIEVDWQEGPPPEGHHRVSVPQAVAEVLAGAAAGAAVGAIAGPPGAVVGAVIGTLVGTVAEVALERDEQRKAQHEAELDADIGVIGGQLGEAKPNQPAAVRGTFSAASMGVGGAEANPSEGPIQDVDE